MKEKYTPFLLSTRGKVLALLGTVALLAAGIYGVTQVGRVSWRLNKLFGRELRRLNLFMMRFGNIVSFFVVCPSCLAFPCRATKT